jgi:Transglutaminase-like superfamily
MLAGNMVLANSGSRSPFTANILFAGSMNKPRQEILRPQQICVLFVLIATTVEVGCRQKAQLPPEIQQQLVANDLQTTEDSVTDPTEKASTADPIKPVPKIVVPCEVDEKEWITQKQLPWTYAEVQYVASTRTGYSTITVDQSELPKLNKLRIFREDVIDRAGDLSPPAQRKVTLETLENLNGEMTFFRFESKVDGANELFVEGRVVDRSDLVVIKREGESPQVHAKIAWQGKNWGPFGIQALLMRTPMKVGEYRSAQIFIPQLLRFVPVVFEAKGMELTPLANGKSQQLLQIDLTIGTEQSGIVTSLFVNQQGVILKTINRSAHSTLSMQVPLETVQRISDQSEFARGLALRVKVTGELGSLPQAKLARFHIDAEDQDPFDILLSYHRQQLNSINADRCELAILPPANSLKIEFNSESKPDASMLENSLLVPTEKEATKMLVAELLNGRSTSSDTQKAEVLRSALHRVWKFQPIASEIASTLVSARDRSGSCVEGSHVLAALLRHEKIASNLVCGLLIEPATSEAQFHVWNQAWLDQQWIDLDMSIPGPVGALHIAMSTTAGSAHNPYSHFLEVLGMIAQIRGIGLQVSE